MPLMNGIYTNDKYGGRIIQYWSRNDYYFCKKHLNEYLQLFYTFIGKTEKEDTNE